MNKQMESSELKNLCSNMNFQIAEQVFKGNDIELMHTFFKRYLISIETGTNHKRNVQLKFILSKITEENVDDMCKILHYALQVQADQTESVKILEYLQSQPISLITLKVLNVLFCESKDLINATIIHIHLDYLLDTCSKEEYLFFISNLLEKFLSYDYNLTMEMLWNKCYEEKSLKIMCSIPTKYLFIDGWLFIIKDNKFWELLILELAAIEDYRYKTAMFTLKIVLNLLENHEFSNNYIKSGMDTDLFKSFHYFCLLLDVSREKQLHLIEPTLKLLAKLQMEKVWVNLVYNKLLCHSHNSVAYQSLIYLMELNASCDYLPMFTALNKSDDSKLCKQVFHKFEKYCRSLSYEKYSDLMIASLDIVWVPVAFYKFYKFALIRFVDNNILLQIIKKCKDLPHKYIRHGVLFLIFSRIKTEVKETICISNYFDIILEFMSVDECYKYGIKLINLNKLIVSNNFINIIKEFLNNPTQLKIDFLIELTKRKNVPIEFLKQLYIDFKERKYSNIVLDRLSYLYLIKTSDLQEYLYERLDSTEESYSICHIDKPNYELVTKSTNILLSPTKSLNQQLLAFEILFYMTQNNSTSVYSHWFNKILNDDYVLPTSTASSFLSLLIKIPTNYAKQNFDKLLNVYLKLFNTQHDSVLVRIYRNFDFILEHLESKDLAFLDISCKRIFYLKAKDDQESAIKYLVRSIALNYKTITKEVMNFLLETLHEATLNENCGDLIIYYTTMYFRYLNFKYDLYPMYKFLLFPYNILSKNERAEYDVCTEIHLHIHQNSPYFRAAEIRKWALEDLLFDSNIEKTNLTVNYLLDDYRKTFNKRYFPDSSLHLQKLRTMQLFTFLLPNILKDTELKESLTNFLLESFIMESHQSSVRLLMQYLLVQLLKENKNALDIIMQMLDKSNNTHTTTITGLLPVLYGLDLIIDQAEFSHKLIENVLVWTMGPNFKLRLYSQKLIKEICYKHRNNFKFKKYDALYKAVNSALNTASGNNLYLDFSMMDVANTEKPWTDHKKLIDLIIIRIPELCSVSTSEWEYFKIKHYWTKYLNENLANQCEELMDNLILTEPLENVQKKKTPWKDILENETRNKNIGHLIVVTSLIESGANLGGLSRTCEIFGGYMLVVDNIKVLETKEFRNLSMTSEKWLNITEVKPANLAEFLNQCKCQKYRIVGVEQTVDSIQLESYKFQEKTLLLLGNERTGIPAPLIPLMDDCVEIQQFGMIRSLNVHVAGALVIWEYTKQNMIKPL